ncbi:hypothetical protein [Bacillus cereus]|nr:hypothetical protein [Bacillus cereus]
MQTNTKDNKYITYRKQIMTLPASKYVALERMFVFSSRNKHSIIFLV